MPLDVVSRGKQDDTGLAEVLANLTGAPGVVVLLGYHSESDGLRVLKTDQTGRLLVNLGSQRIDIVNQALVDTVQQIVTGAGTYRKITFYAKNANALLSIRQNDGTVTAEISIVPNVPLVIEGVFRAALARNEVAGVVSTLQAVVQSDLLSGQ